VHTEREKTGERQRWEGEKKGNKEWGKKPVMENSSKKVDVTISRLGN